MATANIAAQLLSDLKRDFGLTDAQAAGVVGNLMHESGGFQSLQEQNPGSGRGGFGYAQWTGARRNAFENYAASNGLDPNSYEANYGYLKHEIATDPYERRQFNTVKNAKTAAEAAKLVSDNFLRPGTPNIPSRVNYANQALGYAGSPVPPSNIPNTVGSKLSVAPPRIAPTPSMPSPASAALRGMTSPTGGNSGLQGALDQYALRERNRVTPMGVDDRLMARANALPPVASPFGDDPMTPASGPVIATLPSRSNSMFGNDPMTPSSGPVVARVPSRTASDMVRGNTPPRFNGDPMAPAAGPVVATIPSRAPGTGTAPTTRSVPTTRVGNSANNINQARNEQAVQRQVAPPVQRVSSPAAPIPTASDYADIYAQGGPTRPGASLPTTQQILNGTGFRGGGLSTAPDRLAPDPVIRPIGPAPYVPAPGMSAANLTGSVDSLGRPVYGKVPPSGMQVATALSVTPPLPRPRPQIAPSYLPPRVQQQAPIARSPLRVSVIGANPIPYPQPRPIVQSPVTPPSLWQSDPIGFGQWATSQSGDTSVGSQADAAAARASGNAWRESQERKR